MVVAVRRDLKALGRRLEQSGLAAAALAIAAELDAPGNSATSKAACARALTETLTRLRELQAGEAKADRLDELEARRAKRIGGR